jgi:FkbM family methyltransferase
MPERPTWVPVARLGVLLTLLAAVASVASGVLFAPKIALPRGTICPRSLEVDGHLDYDLLPLCGTKLYSQQREELVIRSFFHDRRGGVFLDVGASDYQADSNTYYLEHHLGWTGVAVDAMGKYAADYAAHRPGTRFFNYLVTDHSGATEPFYILGNMFRMSTASKGWADSFGHDDYQIVQVPTIRLDDLLEKAGVTHIDFLTMDIETGEPPALAGFDIDRYHPSLVCIEVTEKVRERVLAYFAAHGYVSIPRYSLVDQVNWYFEPRPGA